MKKYVKMIAAVTTFSVVVAIAAATAVSKNDLLKFGKNYINDAKVIDEKDLVETEIVKTIPFSELQKIKLNIVGGDVRIRGYEGSDVRLKLKLKTDLKKDFNIDKYLEKTENELKIDLTESTKNNDLNVKIFTFGQSSIQWMESLDLVVEVPRQLNQLKINSVTSEINLENLESENVSINSVSGDIFVDTSVFKNINLKTVSGDIKFKMLDQEKYNLDFKTLSGDIQGSNLLTGPSERKMDIETISGDVEIF